MGYFSNGTEGIMYEEQYCERCVHYEDCAILQAHFLYNYDECDKPKSILHILIPRGKNGGNLKCTMFYEGETERTPPDVPLKGTVVTLPKPLVKEE